jgi:hypothetical protein
VENTLLPYHDVVALAPGRGLQLGHGGPGLGLAHAQRDQLLAGQQPGQPALLLLARRIFDEGADRPEVAGLHDVGTLRAGQRHFLDRQHGVHQRATLAAVGLVEGDPEQRLGRQQPRDIRRVRRRMSPLQGPGGQLVAGEAAHRVGECRVLLAQVEIHPISLTRPIVRPRRAARASRCARSHELSLSLARRRGGMIGADLPRRRAAGPITDRDGCSARRRLESSGDPAAVRRQPSAVRPQQE